jgi:hypothetical protein
MPPEIMSGHLDELVTAALAGKKTAAALAAFAPAHLQGRPWESAVEAAFARARAGAGAASTDKPRWPWQTLVTKILPARALGIDPDDKKAIARLAGRDDWAAAIAARALGLWSDGPAPRLPAVCDALVWRSLGLAGKPKKTPPEIRSHFLREILTTGSGAPERILPLLAARELGIVRADLRALREALVRRWLCGQAWQPSAPPPPRAASIGDFASAVRESAEHATDGLFGGRKVFISSLWRGMRAHPTFGALTLDEFKQQLVDAHKAGLLALSRADLTGAMDPSAVSESETSHLESRYHFVERGGQP